jgi:hypothetical protein
MSGYDDDVSAFLKGFGFSEEELCAVIDELNAYRSIPGTTIGRYTNRVISTIEEEDRPTFLKGIILGVASERRRMPLEEPDLTEEEKRIDRETRS